LSHISDADLRAVLAVLVSRAGGTVEISRAEVHDVLRPAAGEPASIDIESTGQGVRVTVRAVGANPVPDPVSELVPDPVSELVSAPWQSAGLRLRVAPSSRTRAVRLIQALGVAATERGHGFRLPDTESAGFCVVVGRWSYRLVLEEQHPRIEWLPDVNDRRVRQRIRSNVEPGPAGRLVLSIPDEAGRYGGRRGRWEDRAPSQLDDDLVAVLSEIEARAAIDELSEPA
jgi:hypothetical protein